MVYTSQSAALAVLEMLVHLGKGTALPAYVLISCSCDEARVLRLDRSFLPKAWHAFPAPPDLQVIGDAWIKDRTSAVLEVPSALVESESNYLLNPQHSDFPSIRIADPKPLQLDLRLLHK